MKKMRNYFLLCFVFIILFGISVGYAVISGKLTINGTSKIGKGTWDVHLEGVSIVHGSVNAIVSARIGDEKTSINYKIPLNIPGEYYEFLVDVKNDGNIPAKLSAKPSLSGVSSVQDQYINYSVFYSDGSPIEKGDLLNIGERRTLRVRVEYELDINESQLPKNSETLNLGFSMNYVQQ